MSLTSGPLVILPFVVPCDIFSNIWMCCQSKFLCQQTKEKGLRQPQMKNCDLILVDLHNKNTWLLAFFQPKFIHEGIWQLALSNRSAPCPCNENDALLDPCVSPTCPALDLPYLCLLCFWNSWVTCTLCVFTVTALRLSWRVWLSTCSAPSVSWTEYFEYLLVFQTGWFITVSWCKPFSSQYTVKKCKMEEMDCVRLAFPQRSRVIHARIRSSSLRS